MKIYDKVSIKEDFDKYKTGSFGIIIELYKDLCYLEMLDENNNTIDILYDVPLSILQPITK
ncbi:MAG: hypothetical protein J6N93_08700 [Clostridia bacterium]|nr:hypothetical protein [Clostridia bacterium]